MDALRGVSGPEPQPSGQMSLQHEGDPASGGVLEVSKEEMLRLMRLWIAEDADSRQWLASIQRRGERRGERRAERYVREQLWQVRKELAERLRSELRAQPEQARPTHARFDTETLLKCVLHASRRLGTRGG